MPSEATPVQRVLEAVEQPIEAFHSALVRAVEDVRGFLASHRAPAANRTKEVAGELGAFGTGRIDADRFSELLTVRETLDAERLHRVEGALTRLEALVARGPDLFRAAVPPGGDLRDTVGTALARIGGAFAMIRVVASARDGRSGGPDPDEFAEGLPVRAWGRSERRMAPPLVVEVAGADLVPGGLAEFLDGGLEIVLVVGDPAPPAPLAGLVRPGIFVVQTTDPQELAPAASYDGPSVSALMPDGAARFVHDPRAGGTYAERLTVSEVPDPEGLAPVGPITVFRQRQDLEHLTALGVGGPGARAEAAAPAAATDGAGPAAGGDSAADHLAGWLLQQAGIGAG